ncbi:TolC family outer membrane protein [Pararhodospirillum oryzae]|nr:TolC family outer membrane protein [Pararhodospirillum oryzae]
MKKSVSIALASVLAASTGWSAAAQAESFQQALESAYQTNPTLQARRILGRAVDEEVPQALSNWRPTVTLKGDTAYKLTSYHPGAKGVDTNPSSLGVVLSQNIFRGFRTTAETEKAEADVQAERSTLKSVEQTVLLNAAQAYFTVIRDQAVLELNRNNEEVLTRQLEAARDRFRVGEITRTDVAQAESRLAGAIADRIAAEGTLETSRANYERVIGHPPAGTLEAPAPFTDLPQTFDDAVDIARRSHPDIIAAEYTWKGAQANIRDQRGKLLPTLAAQVSYSWNYGQYTYDMDTNEMEAGVVLTMPLYQGGAVYSQIRDAKHRAGQRRVQVDEQRDATVESLTSSWENLQSARARVTSYQSQIEAASIALEGVQREAQVGSRTTLDVLDAEQELLTSRVNLARAQRDASIYTYQVLSALGGMTADRLGLQVPLHDPDVHYEQVRGQWFGGNEWATKDAGLGADLDITQDVSDQNVSTVRQTR